MVSDEGKLANMNFDGSDVRYWNVQNSDDLEGLVQIEGRDEYPKQIILTIFPFLLSPL